MKPRTIYWALAALALAVAAYFIFRKKPTDPAQSTPAPGLAPALPPPTATSSEQAAVVTEAEAAPAINNRVAAIEADAGTMANIRARVGFPARILQGVVYPQPWTDHFGNLLTLPTPAEDANFAESLALVGRTKGFEELKNESGFDQAKVRWTTITALPYGVTLRPAALDDLVRQGAFGAVGRRDSDRSERYNAWTTDAKQIAANYGAILPEIQQAVKMQAITDLTAAGWRIRGYNA